MAPTPTPAPTAPAASEPEPELEAEPAPAPASEPAVKPSATLPGQEELAARKGSWTYTDDAAPAEPEAAPEPAAPVMPLIKPSTPLPGQEELAARKGSWTYSGGSASAPEAAPAPAAPEAEAKPETLAAARDGGPDDLKLLKGVGPKLEQTLHELGFYHFDQIAVWTDAEVAWVDSRLKFKGRIERDGWIDQAKILAAGGETEFSKRNS